MSDDFRGAGDSSSRATQCMTESRRISEKVQDTTKVTIEH